jgi:hypothetical protein
MAVLGEVAERARDVRYVEARSVVRLWDRWGLDGGWGLYSVGRSPSMLLQGDFVEARSAQAVVSAPIG